MAVLLRRPPTMIKCLLQLLPSRRTLATAATIQGHEIDSKNVPNPVSDQPMRTRPLLPAGIKLEEETLPGYHERSYYPARIGEVLHERYRIVGKLGYGMSSTVWMCHHREGNRYRTVKICTANASRHVQNGAIQEVRVLQHIQKVRSKHSLGSSIRSLDHIFTLRNPFDHEHTCLVHEPLGVTLLDVQTALGGRLPLYMVKPVAVQMLLALHFLHDKAKVVHTDLQASNFICSVDDQEALVKFEEAELIEPLPYKKMDATVVHRTRSFVPSLATMGKPQLSDFGQARLGIGPHTGDIMPDVYRAPEVILKAPWNEKVDIWNLGMLLWHFLEGKPLIYGCDIKGELNNWFHLGELISFLGPPPPTLANAGNVSSRYFDAAGQWKGSEIEDMSLEAEMKELEGNEKAEFLRLIRRMLQWDPQKRPSAHELMFDDFLTGHYPSRAE